MMGRRGAASVRGAAVPEGPEPEEPEAAAAAAASSW